MLLEAFNEVVREHEITTPWAYQDRAQVIYRWFTLFNSGFFGAALPVSFVRFERARRTSGGRYLRGRNSVGALHEILLNTQHLDRPLHEVLGMLLHAMIHEWQELYGTPGKGGYHNREFCARAQALGIPCPTRYEHACAEYRDPFVALLRRHGVDVARSTPTPPEPGFSHAKKWSCGCTNIRAAVVVEARCLRCGKLFQRHEANSSL
jgi:SprT-like family protein